MTNYQGIYILIFVELQHALIFSQLAHNQFLQNHLVHSIYIYIFMLAYDTYLYCYVLLECPVQLNVVFLSFVRHITWVQDQRHLVYYLTYLIQRGHLLSVFKIYLVIIFHFVVCRIINYYLYYYYYYVFIKYYFFFLLQSLIYRLNLTIL